MRSISFKKERRRKRELSAAVQEEAPNPKPKPRGRVGEGDHEYDHLFTKLWEADSNPNRKVKILSSLEHMHIVRYLEDFL